METRSMKTRSALKRPPSSASKKRPTSKRTLPDTVHTNTKKQKVRDRAKSFDTTYPNDKDLHKYSFDEYLQTTNYINDYAYLENFFGQCNENELLLLDLYQNNQGVFDIDMSTLPMKHIEFAFLCIKILSNLFKRIEGTNEEFYVYRCYQEGVSINTVDKLFEEESNKSRFVSTTLSHKHAQRWCKGAVPICYDNPTEEGDLEICIKIPKGSKVLPLIKKVSRFEQYEILLPPGGKLIRTNECHKVEDENYNVPVYKYEQSEEYINEKEETVEINESEKDTLIKLDLQRIALIKKSDSKRKKDILKKLKTEENAELKEELQEITIRDTINNNRTVELNKRLDNLSSERKIKIIKLKREKEDKEEIFKEMADSVEKEKMSVDLIYLEHGIEELNELQKLGRSKFIISGGQGNGETMKRRNKKQKRKTMKRR